MNGFDPGLHTVRRAAVLDDHALVGLVGVLVDCVAGLPGGGYRATRLYYRRLDG